MVRKRLFVFTFSVFLTRKTDSLANTSIAAVNPPKSAAATGLNYGALGGDEEDGDDEDEENVRADMKSGPQPTCSRPNPHVLEA